MSSVANGGGDNENLPGAGSVATKDAFADFVTTVRAKVHESQGREILEDVLRACDARIAKLQSGLVLAHRKAIRDEVARLAFPVVGPGSTHSMIATSVASVSQVASVESPSAYLAGIDSDLAGVAAMSSATKMAASPRAGRLADFVLELPPEKIAMPLVPCELAVIDLGVGNTLGLALPALDYVRKGHDLTQNWVAGGIACGKRHPFLLAFVSKRAPASDPLQRAVTAKILLFVEECPVRGWTYSKQLAEANKGNGNLPNGYWYGVCRGGKLVRLESEAEYKEVLKKWRAAHPGFGDFSGGGSTSPSGGEPSAEGAPF